MSEARILQLSVGLPRDYTQGDTPWRSAIEKHARQGPVALSTTNFEGDAQADLVHHGGPDKAVCVYPAEHYPYWRERLGRDLRWGAFGENLTLEGLVETDVCIGDRVRVGDVLLEVSQPRSPCWKLSRRWNERRLVRWVQRSGFSGWYARVLECGTLSAGAHWRVEARAYPWASVQALNRTRYGEFDEPMLSRASACVALSESWRSALKKRLGGHAPDERERLEGPG